MAQLLPSPEPADPDLHFITEGLPEMRDYFTWKKTVNILDFSKLTKSTGRIHKCDKKKGMTLIQMSV